MIRPTTLAMLLLAASAGGLLFRVSFEVTALEDKLAELNRGIVSDQDAIHVLRAEWSYLNQPARLQDLAERHLDLKPLATVQMQTLTVLPVRAAPEADVDTDPISALLQAKAHPKLKPAAPLRAVAHSANGGAKPILVAQPVRTRSLNDVLSDVLTRTPVRVE